MTVYNRIRKTDKFRILLNNLICLMLATTTVLFGASIKNGIIHAIRLLVNNIIPSIFPFLILADYWSANLNISEKSIVKRLFEFMFGINGNALTAFLCGSVCGFPLGTKISVDLYNKKIISRDELQLICIISSNPSAAFVISGIGAALYGNNLIGFVLYFSVIFSACLAGFILKNKEKTLEYSCEITRQKFNLIYSIKNAGISLTVISSCIIFFSALISLFRVIFRSSLLNLFLAAVTEVSTACCMIKEHFAFPTPLSLSFTAFTLGFSGFSVHIQTFAFLPDCISKKKYIVSKLFIGLFSFVISYFIFAFLI